MTGTKSAICPPANSTPKWRVVEVTPIAENFQKPVILGVQAVVQDLTPFSQLVRTSVDQRAVVHVLVSLADDGIDRQQRTDDIVPAASDKRIRMLQVLAGRRDRIVLDSIGPKRVIVNVSSR